MVKKLERNAIVHSFHSQVCRTLENLDDEPDLLVSLDSHSDEFLGEKIESMPEEIWLARDRASSHALIRRAIGELPIFLKYKGMPTDSIPEMVLVIPEITLMTQVIERFDKIPGVITLSPYESKDPLKAFIDHLSQNLGIKIFMSPPKNLMKIVGALRRAEYSVLDLDVDYLQEFQGECYTPATQDIEILKKLQPGQIGSVTETLRLIHKTKPPLITISEARVAAIQEPKSNFSRFIDHLKNLGYKVDYRLIFDNDTEAEQLIKIYNEFYETIQKPLKRRQKLEPDYFSEEAFDRRRKELEEVTKRYFLNHWKSDNQD